MARWRKWPTSTSASDRSGPGGTLLAARKIARTRASSAAGFSAASGAAAVSTGISSGTNLAASDLKGNFAAPARKPSAMILSGKDCSNRSMSVRSPIPYRITIGFDFGADMTILQPRSGSLAQCSCLCRSPGSSPGRLSSQVPEQSARPRFTPRMMLTLKRRSRRWVGKGELETQRRLTHYAHLWSAA